jgi:hypothetical protein
MEEKKSGKKTNFSGKLFVKYKSKIFFGKTWKNNYKITNNFPEFSTFSKKFFAKFFFFQNFPDSHHLPLS